MVNKIAKYIRNPTDTVLTPYIIAEVGVNHEGSMDLAEKLIESAAKGGADAVKFQSYKANTIAIKNSPAYWDTSKEKTKTQYELFSKYDKFWKSEFENLARICEQNEIAFMSTPFDIESANFLSDIMESFKISSSDMNNKPFIEHIAQFNKPIILSTGAANLNEINESVSWLKKANADFSLLHCVLNYPCPDENANLLGIKTLIDNFPNTCIGYSDHTLPKDMLSLEIASILGAKILEKHFTHDKNLPGNDHYHAMDENDLLKFCKKMKSISTLLGDGDRENIEEEHQARKYARRSLVSAKKILKGKVIEADDLTFKRPALGIEPKFYDELIGKKSISEIPEDSLLQWEMFEK